MAFPDAWSETALISITAKGESPVQFVTAVETIDIDLGDKDVEYIANLDGGRMEKLTPEGDTTVTFEGYFVNIAAGSDRGLMQLFHTTSDSSDTSEPLDVMSELKRDRFRVAILWTNDVTAALAESTTNSTTDSLRFVIREARMISAKTSMTDGVLKTTFKFKCAVRQKDPAYKNITWQSGDNTALAALATYTANTDGF